jgi:hypothetical protein
MPHSRHWTRDRQLQLIVAIWVLVLIDAIRQGVTLPTSELVANWPSHPATIFLAFAVLAPPILVAANHFFPLRGLWFDWPKRVVDHWFGDGVANRFWRRLRPLALMSLGAFVLGATGYAASDQVGAADGAFAISGIFLGFGIGFLIAALLESYVLGRQNAA